jgi:beta-lactamase superfamily II metal-dependent hydrolase
LGCVYTGDYDASKGEYWNPLKISFKDFWEHTGIVQIPHHGSKNNYSSDLTKTAKNALSVISCAKGRKHHPSWVTCRQILENGGRLAMVTEDPETEIIQYVPTGF